MKAFYDWWKQNSVDLDDNYSKTDMEWIAEQAWNAASEELYEEGIRDATPDQDGRCGHPNCKPAPAKDADKEEGYK